MRRMEELRRAERDAEAGRPREEGAPTVAQLREQLRRWHERLAGRF